MIFCPPFLSFHFILVIIPIVETPEEATAAAVPTTNISEGANQKETTRNTTDKHDDVPLQNKDLKDYQSANLVKHATAEVSDIAADTSCDDSYPLEVEYDDSLSDVRGEVRRVWLFTEPLAALGEMKFT